MGLGVVRVRPRRPSRNGTTPGYAAGRIRRRIKNHTFRIGKIRNPCYKLAAAGLSATRPGRETDCRRHVRSKIEAGENFSFESAVTH